MKKLKATYFSLFFLGCFLVSFSANVALNYSKILVDKKATLSQITSVSTKNDKVANNVDFLFEENENESENDFAIQAFILPFFISYFQYHTEQSKQISAKLIVVNETSPIYLSVCNFRI